MNPVTHLLAGWAVASTAELTRRDRALVTIAGVIPDVDGVGMVAEIATRNSERPLLWWSDYHHVVGHNITFAACYPVVAFALGTKRWRTAALAFASFHLHLLGDLLGGRGPDGDQWPIPYLWPFSEHPQLTWGGQWALNAWPNFVVTGILLAFMFYWAWKKGHSPLGIVSVRADMAFVETLRNRFPPKT